MAAAENFIRAFSCDKLKETYLDKVQYRASVGLDNIAPDKFRNQLDQEIKLISSKTLNGTYHFTRYREVLINKGRGKVPRVISVPTARDKLALAAYQFFLKQTFFDIVDESLLHTIIGKITKDVLSGNFTGYVKADITRFYSTINHRILLRIIKRRIRKKEALSFLEGAITTETISRSPTTPNKNTTGRGVPEGLSISNILADIYLSDLQKFIQKKYSNIKFYRYVDDILILCDFNRADHIKKDLATILKRKYDLEAHPEKTMAGELKDGVPFLGYVFSDSGISIRSAAVLKIETSVEELFRKASRGDMHYELFIWRLNLRIVGCILERKKYGWLFYYSQLSDLQILYHLDWLINRLFTRFGLKKSNDVKSFVRGYHEITKNLSHSHYLINTNLYSIEEQQTILSKIYKQPQIETMGVNAIEELFKQTMFRETQSLERDIQGFS